MKILQAQAMGICFGVRDALDATRRLEHPTQVTILGQLVHNPAVTRELTARGFHLAHHPTSPDDPPQTPAILITAHGISNRHRAQLAATGRKILDTTCPLVRKAHRAALTLANAGYFIIIAGQPDHVEVRGLTGDLDHFEVIETASQVRQWDAPRIALLAQTTFPERILHAIAARTRALNPHAEVRLVNTICQPTRDRQSALERLLGEENKIDVVVVVGGRNSNNTRQLVLRAQEAGVRAIHVEGPDGLREEMFKPWEIVGLTAGTSTLPETIEAVHVRLEGFYKDASRYASKQESPQPMNCP